MPVLPQSPEQQKKLLAGVVAVALLVVYCAFVHAERTAQIDALEMRLEALETANAAAKTLEMDGGAELEKKLAMLEQHAARLEELIPQREEVPDLLHRMTLRAQESGVELIRMSPQLEEPGPYYNRQTYEVAVKGTAHRVGRYLAEIGSLRRIVTPTQLTLLSSSGVTDRNGSPLLDASFRIVTYIVPGPAPREASEQHARAEPRAAMRPAASTAASTGQTEPKLIFEREVFVYPADNRRDPFQPLGVAGAGAMFEDLSLRMIIFSAIPDHSIAVLADGSNRTYRLRTGGSLGNATVVEITPRRAVFVVEDYGNRRREVLELGPTAESEGAGR